MASGISKHKTFKRSYREDYVRGLEVPGISQHIFQTFKMIFGSFKIFLPLILIMTAMIVGILGFLSLSSLKDVAVSTIVTIMILIVWDDISLWF